MTQTGPRDDESVRASRYVLTPDGEAALAAWLDQHPTDPAALARIVEAVGRT